MGKKRKTYYLDESTIQKVKHYASEMQLSENDAFERALEVFETLYYKADEYLPLPIEYKPLLLEAVDNLIYNSKRALETVYPDPELNERAQTTIKQRMEFLYEVRKLLIDQAK